jgi:glycosyltransferase involved in cell wall biosynthesis
MQSLQKLKGENMSRPTISLAVIAKNEAPNVKRLFDSVEGCFDEIVFVDTGSTDGTQDIAKSLGASLYHFDWINDFSAARNFSFAQVKTDYVMWMDLDDVLHDRSAFIDFRDNALKYFDYILAKYNYALDANGKPLISFMRERIMKMEKKPTWNYFVHEGVKPMPGSRVHYCANWAINHLRTADDMAKDKSRNLMIFEEKRKNNQLDGRMTFYFGKEYFENNQPDKAYPILLSAVEMNLEAHDRILCLQYACYALLAETDKLKPEHQSDKLLKIVELAQKALLLDQKRAEFWNIIGDIYIKLGKLAEALPFYAAARSCTGVPMAGDAMAGPIHSFSVMYGEYPTNRMAQIYANLNRFDDAKRELNESVTKYNSEEAKKMISEVERLNKFIDVEIPKQKTEDIVFTCPPQGAYPFDEELYKSKGMGGSETALIEMAMWLKKLTGRPVKVFNMRESKLVGSSGVEWLSTNDVFNYFSNYEPKVHIAWRHNNRLTKAPSYLWCHDLMIPGVENGLNQDKVLSLSPFHRDFLASSQGVDKSRIVLTRNGISPEKWDGIARTSSKNPYKFVYASSPDRGLDRCMMILDLVREKYPVELHVYYGLDNLYKFGQVDLAEKLKKMMADRPWVTYHGFTEQKQMYKECADAAVWLHPNDFIETFQITGLEMLMNGVYPITRRWGAVQDTLKEAEGLGWASLLDIDSVTPEEHRVWAAEAIKAIETKPWEKIEFSPEWYSWKSVAEDWVDMLGLRPRLAPEVSELRAPEIQL